MVEFHKANIRRKINQTDVSIISQNCIGGIIYNYIGTEFSSPTINMFIEDENFVKLVENLPHYLSVTPVALCEKYIDPIDPSISYPKIIVDDIEICCMHYANCDEAILAWERRKKRVNLNKVLIIANSWNMHENEELVKRICDISQYKVICFTYGNYDMKNCVHLDGDFWRLDDRKIVHPILTAYKPKSYKRYFEDFIDISELINCV